MCGYFCTGLIDFIFKKNKKGNYFKSLLDYTYSFSHNNYEKNDKIN